MSRPKLSAMRSRVVTRSAAALLMLMAALAASHGAGAPVPAWPAGLAAWAAGVLLWPRLDPRQRRQVGWLIGSGVLALTIAALLGVADGWLGALTQNNALLGMLVGVSFLQLVGVDGDSGRPPIGRRALWRTLAGVHLFGAVINLSAVFIMADRMAEAGRRLEAPQAALLVRAFLAAAMWSPFFAAVAVALTYAPGSTLYGVVAAGAPFALALLLLAGHRLERELGAGVAAFVGYPMHVSALWLPALLAVTVAAGRQWLPGWSALAVITVAAPSIAMLACLLRFGAADALRRTGDQAVTRLPAMSGELALFLAAAVFAAGLQSLLTVSGHWLPFAHLGALQAALVLGAMIGAALLGVHAVISISLVSAWLAPIAPDPVLLATVFSQSWAVGLAVSPLSGIHLALQGRYGLPAAELARANATYGLQAYALAVLWLAVIAAWRGVALY
ncbi:MAG: hypothetical protein KDH15_20700 [Rhodocyclaceae bacterium]|nr:hypothetical protein [Rhodocyclaceae bacterium]